jgi:hypothetical protein
MPPGKLMSVNKDIGLSVGVDVSQRLVGSCYFMHKKTGGAQSISDKVADQHFIFDHQDRNRCAGSTHAPSPHCRQPLSGQRKGRTSFRNLLHYGA